MGATRMHSKKGSEMIIEPKYRWWYWIHPNTSWFGSFARHFLSPDISVWAEDTEGEPQYFALASHHLSDASSPEELADRSAALKALFDGAMYLAYGTSYFAPPLTNLTDDDDTPSTYLSGYDRNPDVRADPYSAAYSKAKVDDRLDPLDDTVALLLFLARYDPIAKDLLKYVGVQGLTYVTLYAFTDWMNGAGWDDKRIAQAAGWSNARFKNFSATANNPAYLGPFCRHGGTSAAPNRPVPLEEAIDPMRKAAVAFLSDRARTVGLAGYWQSLARP